MTIEEILDGFEFVDDWEERYRFLIELGRDLEPLPPEAHSAANKVEGCTSQVWLETIKGDGPDPTLSFRGDSDAHLVRGLVAVLIALYSGRPATAILATDAGATLDKMGLKEHLTPQRSNGVRAMVERIKREAAAAAQLAPATATS
jgi:cysteine desulfuration protein SufE